MDRLVAAWLAFQWEARAILAETTVRLAYRVHPRRDFVGRPYAAFMAELTLGRDDDD